MTNFTDGPAAGTILELRRAPLFLRVVSGASGWDALDQLTDTPLPDETITVYVLVENHGWIHLNRRDKNGKNTSGTFQRATYRVFEEQPEDMILRTTARWRAFCEATKDQLTDRTPLPNP